MASRTTVRFIRKGRLIELSDVRPAQTILDYLRLEEGATGTKEGCCEGDCGACTVAVASLENGSLSLAPVNACIQLLATIDGKELITVEDLAAKDGTLHPVQKAMVENHGSQCGFCTPGFVMSLFVLSQQPGEKSRSIINEALAGNLCRCTGYRPIIDAARAACNAQVAPHDTKALRQLCATQDTQSGTAEADDIFIGNEEMFLASPASEKSLAELLRKYPQSLLVAGATDVGLWITKQQRDLPQIIYIGRVAELQKIEQADDRLILGAGVTYQRAEQALDAIDPEITTILKRIGSKQVRSVGTIGGNIANGSPIGDMPPMLIALGSSIELASSTGRRVIALEDFFIEYGRQDRATGEYLANVIIPRLAPNQSLRCYKVSKRFDQDISAVMAGFCFTRDSHDANMIAEARLAFGGMAGIPARARNTEAALKGLAINDEAAWHRAVERLDDDFTPLSDMRASADYRLSVAKGLILKARAELAGNPATRVLQNHALQPAQAIT